MHFRINLTSVKSLKNLASSTKANALRWFGNVLRTKEDNHSKMAMNFDERATEGTQRTHENEK